MKKTETALLRIYAAVGFLVVIILLSSSCKTSVIRDKQSLIDSISAKWVPDKREGICTVAIAPGIKGTVVLRGETTVHQAKGEIIEALKDLSYQVVDSIVILPDTIKNDHFMGIVAQSVINLRKEPRQSAELLSQAIMGKPVLVLKSNNSWILIQTPDKYIAWTERSSVKPMTTAEMNEWKKSEKVIYLENYGSVFSAPDQKEVAGDLVAGCIIKKTGEIKGFAKIEMPDGQQGFISMDKLKDYKSWKSETRCTPDNIKNVASKYLGLPYLWGGTSSKAVDCSGFVQSVFFINGLILSRDASLQGTHGETVDISNGLSELKRGDLLFFGSSIITHVAIYLGDSEFIHASSHVMVNSLDSTRSNYSGFRKRTLLVAKRIIGVENDKGIIPVSEHEWY